MKSHLLIASLGLGLALPIPALAADHHQQPGHFEPVPQFGPRSTGPALKWVPDHAQQASCDYSMMEKSASKCMMPMHHMGSPKSDGSAG
jgi:hypothetical protein